MDIIDKKSVILKLQEMLDLQNKINGVATGPEWINQDSPWYRAVWLECAELMEHLGWKWWKKPEINIKQAHLELVDIWHFGLTILFRQNSSPEAQHALCEEISAEVERISEKRTKMKSYLDMETTIRNSLWLIETFAFDTIKNKEVFNTNMFFTICYLLDLSFDDLYVWYCAKNALNFFRQDHGYREGTYVKRWGELEDNEHLAMIIEDGLKDPNGLTYTKLYNRLEEVYQLCQSEQKSKTESGE